MKFTFDLCYDLTHFSKESIEAFYISEYKRTFMMTESLFMRKGLISSFYSIFEILLNDVILRTDMGSFGEW